MKILLSWLREYLPQTSVSALPGLFTRAGIEVDHTEVIKCLFNGVVAARVTKVSKHSGCSHLVCATVFDGKNEHTVVCGASNCREGMITAYAPIGALVAKKRIDATQFGDVRSEGMLCSEHELGLSEFHEGIMDLPNSVTEGTLLEEYFADTVYEVSVTPNLGHCQSVMGIARELSAFMGTPLAKRSSTDSAAVTALNSPKMTVTVEDPQLCSRYSALLLEGVVVGPSSSHVRIRLERSGLRSINNVVDATNYISLDIGQPLHAFDADRVRNGHLIVRASKEHETLTMLDETTHKLPTGTIVISDGEQILAAGGIMGGESSAVSATTTRIILESAHFNPSAIRKARTKLSISTDSSKRFERGADSGVTLKALDSAFCMLKVACPKLTVEALVDVEQKCPEKIVTCRLSRANLLLGYDVSANEAELVFSNLGLASTFDGQDTYSVRVPSFRHDITEEVDLIEEIGRLMGLQRDMKTPSRYAASSLPHHPLYLFEGEVRRRLLSFGLQEAITSDLISPAMAAIVTDHNITDDALVKMVNPLSAEQSILRPSLLPGLLDVVQRNANQRTFDLRFFEVGHAHLKKGNGFVEPRIFSIMLAGCKHPEHFSQKPVDWDFYDLKGMLEELFTILGFGGISVKKSELSMLHPGRQAKVYVGDVHVGIMGEIHPELLAKLDVPQTVLFAECDMQELLNIARIPAKMQELPIFPSSDRDWTITISKNIRFNELMAKIDEVKPAICQQVSLTSIFEHEKLGLDKHNLTLHFVYRDKAKTISQEEVDKAHQTLVSGVLNYLAEKYPE